MNKQRKIRGAAMAVVIGMLLSTSHSQTQPATASTPSPAVAAFLAHAGTTAAGATATGANAVAGEDGWLFFAPELRHLSAGPFWGPAAAGVSRAPAAHADPVPAIVDCHEQLKARGIKLILMPVPAKAAIWPDKVPGSETGQTHPRVDIQHAVFYDLLREKGVAVLDLAPVFRAQRDTEHGPVHCRTDTHWSGAGVVLAAQALAARLRALPDVATEGKTPYRAARDTLDITGDLVSMLPDAAPKPEPETLQLRFIATQEGDAPQTESGSPVLLMGDSHTLVFHAGGDLHAGGAGLPDQLAHELGRPVDLMGTRGSGTSTVRIDLYRQSRRDPDYLNGKKAVVWCFTARDFTESTQGWRKMPVSP